MQMLQKYAMSGWPNDKSQIPIEGVIMTASTQDGAFAWMLCGACFFNITMLGGFILTSGMFYIMFRESLDATDSQVALIPAINIGVMHIICPFAGVLSQRYGVRSVSIIGTILSTAGLAGGAFSTKIYHLYLSYGFIAGLGLGMVFNCSISILDPYFKKYKRIACGLAICGFGVGSFIFPPILKFLEDIYGWRGTILLLSGINFHMMLTSALFRPFKADPPQVDNGILKGNVLLSEKDKPCRNENQLQWNENARRPIKLGSLQHELMKILSLFKIIPFFCLIAVAFLYAFGLSIVLTHFGSYVSILDFLRTDVVTLYMTFGISSTIARLLIGIVVQVTNANGGTFVMAGMLLNGILTMCVPFMTQLWMLYVYSICFQILITPFNIFSAVLIMEHVPKSQVAVAYGVLMVYLVPGYSLGGPIGVWLYGYTQVYGHIFFLAGGIILMCGLTMAPASYHIHKNRH